MSEQSPYETLGVSEEASFDEVQTARSRLLEEFCGDRKQADVIEAAYDAVLMDRLRMRQEGKIKVPERIRFPERLVQPPPSPPVSLSHQSPAWLRGFLDTPSRGDILWPAGLFTVLSSLSLLFPAQEGGILQLTLSLGIGFSLYFLNRKERKFGRAFLLTLAGLLCGLLLGSLLVPFFQAPILAVGLTEEKIITVITFLVLWLVDSFLR
ncbi:molecular chaperone DnaJ [Neosynechococcus sphagnicola sy1]|uniref:Molecular chaperone DnaJ n=1 Tax=Neosynechococcus sphagnicola sy1 TaxID=1497020 RepID=A0A098TL39_9CYAN|nr:CPP1-like family protein [Neosynechococcus sphagnicola]KGF72562.1 molecular chaperone DnaJ [Neosynechococcus sphagnicola sy1]